MLAYDSDSSHSGGTKKRRPEILASFGRDEMPGRRHPLRRGRRDVRRRRVVYAFAAIAVVALLVELVLIVLMRR